jgi:hypothetical protein
VHLFVPALLYGRRGGDPAHHIVTLRPHLPRATWGIAKAMMPFHWLPTLLKLLNDALMLEGAGIGMPLHRASVVDGA